MKFSYYRLMITLLLMGYEFFIIVSMALNEKIKLVINICIAFFLIMLLCKEEVKAGGIE